MTSKRLVFLLLHNDDDLLLCFDVSHTINMTKSKTVHELWTFCKALDAWGFRSVLQYCNTKSMEMLDTVLDKEHSTMSFSEVNRNLRKWCWVKEVKQLGQKCHKHSLPWYVSVDIPLWLLSLVAPMKLTNWVTHQNAISKCKFFSISLRN